MTDSCVCDLAAVLEGCSSLVNVPWEEISAHYSIVIYIRTINVEEKRQTQTKKPQTDSFFESWVVPVPQG